ncbi:MAG: prepilin-type N-terminal cleavage/methylation domain-containing protein [Candidatus Brocadia sp.]|nr:MAG: prepilin-type N-terminal cleavage/methylation domain-containing protein [Candidatus Brocadia sp.]
MNIHCTQKPITEYDDGFTVLEVIFAIAIITIGLFAAMSMVTIVTTGNTHSKSITTATTMAQDKLEYFKKIDYSSIAGTSLLTGTSTVYYLVADVVTSTNTKTITVDVYWNPATATSSHKVELKTIRAED